MVSQNLPDAPVPVPNILHPLPPPAAFHVRPAAAPDVLNFNLQAQNWNDPEAPIVEVGDWRPMPGHQQLWVISVREEGLGERAQYPSRVALAPWTNELYFNAQTGELVPRYIG